MRTVKKAFNQADSVPLCSRCCDALLFRCLLSMQYTNTFKSIVCWELKMKCLPETSLSWRKLPHPSYPRAIHTQWHTDQFSSVQFSRSGVSDSLRPHESQHAGPPCSSPTPRVYSNSCPSIQWCHPATSSSVVPFSSCPQSHPASGSFPMSQLFPWGSQSTGVSASASVLPMNTQDWSPLGWTGSNSL